MQLGYSKPTMSGFNSCRMVEQPAPVDGPEGNIQDALSMLASTLQLSSGSRDPSTLISNNASADVSGMLQSLSASVPALAGPSPPAGSSAHTTLTAEARGPSGGLSGLGPQLLQLQQHMQDSHDNEQAANSTKHRSAAAAIAAALHQATPEEEEEMPDAPDFTLLSETVSESLQRGPPKDANVPKSTTPVPPPPIPALPEMKVSIKPPAAPIPPPLPIREHARLPPAAPRPPLHVPGSSVQSHSEHHPRPPPPAPPPRAAAAVTPNSPAGAPPSLTGGQKMHARGLEDRGPLSTPSVPRPAPSHHPSTLRPRPQQNPQNRPELHSVSRAAQNAQTASGRTEKGLMHEPPRPPSTAHGGQVAPASDISSTTVGRRSVSPTFQVSMVPVFTTTTSLTAAVHTGGSKMGTTQQERSVVHPTNPLKRIPVSAAQAMKPAGKLAGPRPPAEGPTAVHRLAAAKAPLDHKKGPQPIAASSQSSARADPMAPRSHAPMKGDVKSQDSADGRGSHQHVGEKAHAVSGRTSDTHGTPVQVPESRSKPAIAQAPTRTMGKRPQKPFTGDADSRHPPKKMKRSDDLADVDGRPDRIKTAVGDAKSMARQRNVNPTQAAAFGNNDERKAGAEAAVAGMRGKARTERGSAAGHFAARAPAGARATAVAARVDPRSNTLHPAETAADDDSSEDDMVRMQRSGLRKGPPGTLDIDSRSGSPKRAPAAAAGHSGGDGVPGSPQRRQHVHKDRAVFANSAQRQPLQQRPFRLMQHIRGNANHDSARRDLNTHSHASGKIMHAPPVAGDEACRLVPSSHWAVRSAVVSHDVEVQTEPPDVRDSSMQTTQMWGRSTACQVDMASAQGGRMHQPCHTNSLGVQRDAGTISVEERGGEAHGIEVGGGGANRAARTAADALRAVRNLLPPQLRHDYSVHEFAILEILASFASPVGREGTDTVADDQERSDRRKGTNTMRAVQKGVTGHADDSSGLEMAAEEWHEDAGGEFGEGADVIRPESDAPSAGISEQGDDAIRAASPRSLPQHVSNIRENVVCSPDEVPLNRISIPDESPDEAPIAPTHGEDGSDDEAFLGQTGTAKAAPIVQDTHRVQESSPGGAQGDGDSDTSAASEGQDASVVKAAIMCRLRKLLPKADLNVATAKSVRGRLQFILKRDLKAHMPFIKMAINDFLEDPEAFSIETPEEARLAGQLASPMPSKTARVDPSHQARVPTQYLSSRGTSQVQGNKEDGRERLREGVVGMDRRLSPGPDLVGRLNGSAASLSKRKGGAALYCQSSKSAKERFRTSMTSEQLREAKEAAKAFLP